MLLLLILCFLHLCFIYLSLHFGCVDPLDIWPFLLVFHSLDQFPFLFFILEGFWAHQLKFFIIKFAYFEPFWMFIWVSGILSLLNFHKSSIWADFGKTSRHGNHSFNTSITSILITGILFNIVMSLRLCFRCFKKRLSIIWGQISLCFGQSLLGFLFESLLKIWLKVVQHVFILDS